MSEKAKQNQPTEKDYEAFDFYWQHLRLNEHYLNAWNEFGKLDRQEAKLERRAKQEEATRLCKLRKRYSAGEIRGPEFVAEQEKKTPANIKRSELGRLRGAIAMTIGYHTDLPTEVDMALLDPAENDSRKVLDGIVAVFPGYLTSASFQRLRLKTSGAAAIWNWRGSEGCAWRNTSGKPGDSRQEILSEPPCGDSHTFENLETCLGIAKQRGDAKALMKCKENTAKFLQTHSQMDFVLDTSLPWGTVAKELEKLFNGIKKLRKKVGLKEDEDPKRMSSKWQKQLAVYDAYLPIWRQRRAVQEIGQKALGFVDSLTRLGVTLTKEDLALAEKLDERNQKPKDFYQLLDEHKKRTFLACGWDEGIEHLARERERRAKQRTKTGFDDDLSCPMTAVLSKRAVRALPKDFFGAVGATLDGWQRHFGVPSVPLKPPFDKISRKNRNRWFHWASERIEAAWHE